jgi:hypothetical protein
MPNIPTMMQLPIGLVIGTVSVIAPGLLRPFVIVALVLAGIQAVLLYQAGGTGAVEVALSWLVALVRDITFILVGAGIGRLAASIVFGRGD